jgi:hypothetical protein
MEYPELKRAVCEQCAVLEASVVLIEDKASGTQLIQELVQDGLHAVTRYQPQSDKIMRSRRCRRQRLSRQAKLRFAESMHAQTAMIENGFVRLPKEAGWLAEYLHEVTAFPKGPTRRPGRLDGPDARLVQAGQQRPSSNAGIWHLYKERYEAQQAAASQPQKLPPLSTLLPYLRRW